MATTPLTQKDIAGTHARLALQQGGYTDTDVLRRLHERTQVVCRIVLKTGQSGTGFLIGKDLIMTNHHVLESKETACKAQAVFFYTNPHQEGVAVDLDPDQFFCTSSTPDRLGFKPITKIKLDFTIVSIKSHPKITSISHLAFSIFNSPELKMGNYANIIHHPVENNGSSTQKVSFRDNVVKESTLFTLHYTTHTMPGSSGAPVMDDQGNLIALHRAACTELLQALLQEDVLKALLKQLFPRVVFLRGAMAFKDPEGTERKFHGLCAIVDSSLLYIFSEGELKGKYFHWNKMKSPASLFELIQIQHNPPKEWAFQFLKQQKSPVLDHHRECNIAVRISAIYRYLQDVKLLDQIKEKYEATQKDLYTLLKESYLRHLAFLPLILTNAEFPIESFFTQLSIVFSASQEKKEEEIRVRDPHLVEKDSLREIYTRLHHPDESLEIDTLFNDRSGNPVTKVLILGRAGIGKSTLCQKIVYDWALGILFKGKFAVVYHLRLRDLNVWIEQNSFKNFQDPDEWLSNAISEFCYQGAHQKKIFQELQNHPDKILVIFDGWDEASPAVIKAVERCFLKTRIKHYLLTSRPGVTANIHSNFDLIVENMGFTDKQVEVYAEKFFIHTKSLELKTFLSNLRSHSDLFTIAHIPIQLQILCALWQKGEKEFPQTLTLMFSKVTSRLFEWAQSKQAEGQELPRSKKQLLDKALGRIALKGLDSKQLILPKTLVDDALGDEKFDTISSKDLINTGLVKGCGENGEMYFIHLTYQEYAIAESISSLPTEEQRDFIQAYRYKPHFHLVIRMLSGCIWQKTNKNLKALETFFEWLYSEPIDLIGSYQAELVLSCLDECRSPKLEDIIWEKYKIANFVEYVSKDEMTPVCLSQLMSISQRAFLQVVKKLQKEDSEKQISWFFLNLSRFIKKEYLSDDFSDFMRSALSNKDNSVRINAAKVLGKVAGRVGENRIPELLNWLQRVLNDEASEVRRAAANAFGEVVKDIGENHVPELLNWLQKAFNDEKFEMRWAAARALGEVAKHVGESHIPELLDLLQKALNDEASVVRRAAAKALWEVAKHVGESHVPELLNWLQKALNDEASVVRRAAAKALWEVAKHVRQNRIPQLLGLLQRALNDEWFDVRQAAAEALGEVVKDIGENHVPELLDLLQKALNDEEFLVRWAAARALKEVAKYVGESHLSELLNWLQRVLNDEKFKMRPAAAEALGEVAKHVGESHVPELLNWLQRALNDEWFDVRQAAAEALGEVVKDIGENSMPQLLNLLQKALNDKESSIVRWAATRALEKVAKHVGESHVPELLNWLQRALNDEWFDVRQAAAEALGEVVKDIGENSMPQLLNLLQKALNDKESSIVRWAATRALEKVAKHVGENSMPQFLDLLQKALNNEKSEVRQAAAEALEEVAKHVGENSMPQFLDLLQKALNNEKSEVRHAVAGALREVAKHVGENSMPQFLDLLQKAFNGEASEVRHAVARALGEVAKHVGENHVPELLNWLQKAFNDEKFEMRWAAARALREVVKHVGESHIPELLDLLQKALNDKVFNVRGVAARALREVAKHIGESHVPELLNWLQRALNDEWFDARQAAAEALGEVVKDIGENHVSELLDLLQKALNDEEFLVRWAAARALKEVAKYVGESHLSELLNWLQRVLNDEKFKMRPAVAEALKEMAKHVGENRIPELLDLLQKIFNDEASEVRRAAAGALVKVVKHVGENSMPQLLNLLQKALNDEKYEVRSVAAEVFREVAKHVRENHMPQLLDLLQKALNDEKYEVRSAAAEVFREVAKHVRENSMPQLLNLLQKALNDEKYEVRSVAAEVFREVAKHVRENHMPQLLDLLQKALNDEKYEVRSVAAEVFREVAKHVRENHMPQLLDLLQKALNDEKYEVRSVAAEVFREVAKHVRENHIPDLLNWLQKALNDEKYEVRSVAAEVFREVAKHVRENHMSQLLDLLQKALNNKEFEVFWAAVDAMGSIHAPSLITIFTSKDLPYSITSFIFQHLINQATPLYLVENDHHECFIQMSETWSKKIDQEQKELLLRRIHEKGKSNQ